MSTEVKEGSAGADSSKPTPDPIKNLKAEMDRKLSNLEASNAKLIAALEAMNKPAPQAEPKQKKISDVIFDNPDEAVDLIEKRITKSVDDRLSQREAASQKQTKVLTSLVADYPELGIQGSDLHTRAVELFEAMEAEEKTHPVAYKTAVAQAASELGYRPKAKRSADDDSFSMGSGGGGRPPRDKKEKEDPNVEAIASLLGVDMANVKKRQRKNYGKWE
jgi:hypothetical protein